jgi:hypothetical protein
MATDDRWPLGKPSLAAATYLIAAAILDPCIKALTMMPRVILAPIFAV